MLETIPTSSIPILTAAGWKRLPAYAPRWPQAVYTDGKSILMPAVHATCFGGDHDQGDDGQTASGIRTDGRMGVAGCALPLPAARACRGTPLPQLPWKTRVVVTLGALAVQIPLIDEGPAGGLKSNAMIDLTWPVVRALKPNLAITAEAANWWSGTVNVYIPDVGEFLTDYLPWGCKSQDVVVRDRA